MTSFSELGLIDPLLRSLSEADHTVPTPIQTQAIPHLLEGRDLLGCAQTGTGKTAAFALPILQQLTEAPQGINGPRTSDSGRNRRGTAQTRLAGRNARVLVLSPTRELAAQTGDNFRIYGKYRRLSSAVIFGGVGQDNQVRALRAGVDILVATPGRLMDLMDQGYVRLDNIEILVLDEADRMLDMGFINDIRRIINKMPSKRQTMLFSATMPLNIAKLADDILTDPVKVSVTPVSSVAGGVEQWVCFVDTPNKRALLGEVLKDRDVARALIFTRTKHGADRVAKHLERSAVHAEAIHGDKSQSARLRALANFRSGRTSVLVATDLAARGLDVEGVTHVVNFDIPNEPESYVHRIGRTARAGARGVAISFCDTSERPYLRDIEKLLGVRVPVVQEHPYRVSEPVEAAPAPRAAGGRRGRTGGGSVAQAEPTGQRTGSRQGGGRRRRWGGNRGGAGRGRVAR